MKHLNNRVQVIAGAATPNDECNQVSNVQEIKPVPSYKRKRRVGRDLAILVLTRPLQFVACKVRPMRLPPPAFKPKERAICSVYGWGTVHDPKKKELKSELSVSQVKIRWINDCFKYFPNTRMVSNSTICSAQDGHRLYTVV